MVTIPKMESFHVDFLTQGKRNPVPGILFEPTTLVLRNDRFTTINKINFCFTDPPYLYGELTMKALGLKFF